mmetsp:Transcript_19952/g.48581  ORF Transcript_19952/g.48581 Transcript_19952/m.48581 type:complete len:454 (+) Transcript_19952:118-1479(+)
MQLLSIVVFTLAPGHSAHASATMGHVQHDLDGDKRAISVEPTLQSNHKVTHEKSHGHSHGGAEVYGAPVPLDPHVIDLESCTAGSSGVHPADGTPKHCRPWSCGKDLIRQYQLQQRARYEVHTFNDTRWDQLLDAFRLMYKQPDDVLVDNSTNLFDHVGRPSTAAFTDLHARSHMHHGSDTFFPFHRRMMLDVETQLQMLSGDCTLTLPYWNWAEETYQFDTSVMWTPERLGSLKPGCVDDGLANDWKYIRGHDTEKTCLVRGTTKKDAEWSPSAYNGYLPSWSHLQTLLSQMGYGELRKNSENWHNAFHCMVHGDMCSLLAPRDPVFYFHHSMIDRYWYYWQQRHPEEQAGCGNCSAGLHSFGGVVAEEYVGTIRKDEHSPTGECVPQPTSDPSVCLTYVPETYHVAVAEKVATVSHRGAHVGPDGKITSDFDPVMEAQKNVFNCLCPHEWH